MTSRKENDLFTRLHALSENDINIALMEKWVKLPITTSAEAVEFVNVIVDHLTGEWERRLKEQ